MNEKINKLKEKIDTLTNEVQSVKAEVEKIIKEEKPKSKRFIPQVYEDYFWVNAMAINEISKSPFKNDEVDIFNVKTRNCFRTIEEAENYKRFIDIECRLRDLADELEEPSQRKHSFFYDCDSDKIRETIYSSRIHDQLISCKNKEFLKIALEKIGFEDLKFYLTYKR